MYLIRIFLNCIEISVTAVYQTRLSWIEKLRQILYDVRDVSDKIETRRGKWRSEWNFSSKKKLYQRRIRVSRVRVIIIMIAWESFICISSFVVVQSLTRVIYHRQAFTPGSSPSYYLAAAAGTARARQTHRYNNTSIALLVLGFTHDRRFFCRPCEAPGEPRRFFPRLHAKRYYTFFLCRRYYPQMSSSQQPRRRKVAKPSCKKEEVLHSIPYRSTLDTFAIHGI